MKKGLSFFMIVALTVVALCLGSFAAVNVDGYTSYVGNGIGVWLGTAAGRYQVAAVAFNSLSDFSGFGLPQFWASNGSNEALCTYTFGIYSFNTDIDTSITGEALFSQDEAPTVDVATGIFFDFGKTLPAGEYVACFKFTSDEGYFVLPYVNPAFSNLRVQYNTPAFGFYLSADEKADGNYFGRLSGTEGQDEIETGTFSSGGVGNFDGLINLQTNSVAVRIVVPAGRKLKSVTGVASPTWTETEGCDATATVYAWSSDYDATVAGDPVAQSSVKGHADNSDITFNFDGEIGAGEYLIEFVGDGTGKVGLWRGAEKGEFIAAFQDGVESSFYPTMTYSLIVLPDDAGSEGQQGGNEGGQQEGQQGGQQGQNPGTADASMVIFVVAAAAIALIILKKKAF